jgi:hypothetical protein
MILSNDTRVRQIRDLIQNALARSGVDSLYATLPTL